MRVCANLWLFCSLKIMCFFSLSSVAYSLCNLYCCVAATSKLVESEQEIVSVFDMYSWKKYNWNPRATQKIASLLFYFICLFIFFFSSSFWVIAVSFALTRSIWCCWIFTGEQNIHNCRHLRMEVKKREKFNAWRKKTKNKQTKYDFFLFIFIE